MNHEYITRRNFFRWILGFSLLPFFPLGEVAGIAYPRTREEERSISAFFNGEELTYEISFWIFKKAAMGRLSFKEMEEKDRYIATLRAETMGILGFVARYRVDTYRSVMEEIEEGSRLRAISFEEEVKIGNRLRKRVHYFDYHRSKWIQSRWKKDGGIERIESEIPPGMIYDDFITASYNFRYGVYGKIERGKRYKVATFPRKGLTSYEVNVAEKEEEEKKRRSERIKEGKEYYVKLSLDPEVTHSKEGLIEGWLSREFYPVEGAIKDVILFGDVRGTLVKITRT
jgi:hypothetical protein